MYRKIIKARTAVHDSVAKVFNSKRLRESSQTHSSQAAPTDDKPSLMSRSPLLLFAREFLQHPRAMGAAFPSSKHLAQGLMSFVPPDRDGIVVELGGGTGIVTEALLQRVSPDNLIVLERSADLVAYLRKRFPMARVIEGDAAHLSKLLGEDQYRVHSIVSGLPMRSIPRPIVHNIIREVDNILPKNGIFVQFTYDLRGRVTYLPRHFKHISSKIIWNNLPPARINVYQSERVDSVELKETV